MTIIKIQAIICGAQIAILIISAFSIIYYNKIWK